VETRDFQTRQRTMPDSPQRQFKMLGKKAQARKNGLNKGKSVGPSRQRDRRSLSEKKPKKSQGVSGSAKKKE